MSEGIKNELKKIHKFLNHDLNKLINATIKYINLILMPHSIQDTFI